MDHQPWYSGPYRNYFCLPPEVFQKNERLMSLLEIYSLLLLLMFAVYGSIIGFFTIGLLKDRKRLPSPTLQARGFVSVIVAVRNEACNIMSILEEMHGQDYPHGFMEVIVTDDYSEDDTMAIAGRYAKEHPEFPLVLATSPLAGLSCPGKKMAIERAVALAKGEVLLFTDADTGRGPGWISSMVSGFESTAIQMVLGPVYFCNERNLLQRIQSLEFMGLMGTTAGSAALGYPVMCNGANLAYRREAFLQTGGFSINLGYSSGDDQFMLSAIRKRFGKGSIVFNADQRSIVSTGAEATLKGFIHQRIRWVSKSRGYRDPAVILVGIVTYLVHFLLAGGIILGALSPVLFRLSLFLWLAKILLEYPMVWTMMRFFGKKKLAGYYFIAQVFQLFYVPLAGMLGLLLPYKWKGRLIADNQSLFTDR
jgi:poly-beta-1,6-N-acetyl-D-glucosamine synthase